MMIATGGLLRINRRQDSLRSKNRKEEKKRKRKAKRKRKCETVVVKGKLKLCSFSGLVAVLGILVLLGGVLVAILGYWPRDGLFGATHHTALMFTAATEEENMKGGGGRGGGFNGTEHVNGTDLQVPLGYLEDFLDRYLYSNKLKVLGPLIMGIGIFLFICANAVLHENRDKKTKVINLRDIYSTVIDLHSLRKNNTADCCPSANPLNGLVNYVQSKSLEGKPSAAYAAALLAKRGGSGVEDGGGRGRLSRQPSLGSRGSGGERDGVFSIYRDGRDTPLLSPCSSHLPPHLPNPDPADLDLGPNPLLFSREAVFAWPRQQGAGCAFTLPLSRPRAATPTQHRRHSARGWAGPGRGREGGASSQDELLDCREYGTRGEQTDTRAEEEREEEAQQRGVSPHPSPRCSHSQNSMTVSRSTSSIPREALVCSQALLLLSSSSLSSLSHLLSSSSSTPPICKTVDHSRRLSTAGYTKLAHTEGESFESTEGMFATASGHMASGDRGQRAGRQEVTSQQRYSNKEKLIMISQTDDGMEGRREEV